MLWPYHIFSWPKAYLDSSEATRWQNYEASWVLATKVLDGWQICQRSQALILCVWLFFALMGRRRWEAWFLGPEAGVPVAGGWRSASEGSGGLREADWAFVGEEEEGGSGQGGLHYWAAATSTTLSYQGTIPLFPQTKAQSHYLHKTRQNPTIPTKPLIQWLGLILKIVAERFCGTPPKVIFFSWNKGQVWPSVNRP